jgi:NTP pyrophosphatase (non-canonical NTP hydrolase)
MPTDLSGALARLTEECGEVLKVVGKIGRFGLNATDKKTGLTYSNGVDLEMELIDLKHAIADVERRLKE